jgi:hypothetical protein
MDVGEVAAGMALGLLKGAAKEAVKECVEVLAERLSYSKGIITSVIYFTVFEPKASEGDVREFVEKAINRVGTIENTGEGPLRMAALVGKSRFWLQSLITRLNDILFYEAMYNEFIDAIEGAAKYLEVKPEEGPAKELGIEESEVLEKIVDVTLIIYPEGKVRAEDVYTLIKTFYDKASELLISGRATLKIRIFGYEKDEELNIIEGRLKRLKVSTYRSREKPILTAILMPSQMLDREVYKAIYGGRVIDVLLKRH